MKYADIPLKTARKCCKKHSYKNKKGQVIPKCKTCPLERPHKFCWFMIKSIHDEDKDKLEDCPIFKAEYDALLQEDVKKILEWENWINSQDTQP